MELRKIVSQDEWLAAFVQKGQPLADKIVTHQTQIQMYDQLRGYGKR